MTDKEKKRVVESFLWIFLLAGMLFTLFLIYKKDFYMENSDIASDMILGKLLSKEGGILSKNWYYSTELHVVHTQLLYKLLFKFWPDNWLMVRVVAAFIFLVLIVASFLFMASSVGLKKEGLLAAGILTWPFGQWYVRIVTFGQSYVTYFIIAFLSMGLFFNGVKALFYKKDRIKAMVLGVLLGILAFIAGLGGVRLLMICYAPLFATGLLLLLYAHVVKFKASQNCEEVSSFSKVVFGLSMVPFVFSCIGLYINRSILCNNYYFQDQFREVWKNFSFSDVLNCLTDAFTLFGWHAEVGFVSWQGLINCVNFLLIIGILVSIIFSYKRLFSFEPMVQLFLAFGGMLTIVTLVVLSCSYKYYSYYWLPVIPYFLLVLGIGIYRNESDYLKHYQSVLCGLIACSIVLSSISVYADPNPKDIYQDYNIVDAIEWLKGTDYEDGFALFWSSNVIIALTNGRIDMHTVEDIDNIDDPSNEYEWLQDVRHKDSFPEGKFFVLVSARDYDLGNSSSAEIFKLSDHLIYGTDNAYIYGFQSMDEYRYAVDNAE